MYDHIMLILCPYADSLNGLPSLPLWTVAGKLIMVAVTV